MTLVGFILIIGCGLFTMNYFTSEPTISSKKQDFKKFVINVDNASKDDTQSISTNQKKSAVTSNQNTTTTTQMRKPVNWELSSETKSYPNTYKYKNMWINVSVKNQRVYLMDGNNTLYTMYCVTAINNLPKDTFYIQKERRSSFFDQKANTSVNNWISFDKNNKYFFHSVPTKINGSYIDPNNRNLKFKKDNKNCIILSMTDSKWLFDNIKTSTKVVVS